ncbi:hypothetical protein SLS58_007131 [Diplodia intermedia]|uniref:Uncharacterized protein n=1 Tax=Diplodia intermedia TaxID=856260 RepID=A0ABR3TKW9_9PEZI
MSADETSLLVFLAEMARLREAASPSSSSHWHTRHLTLRERALKSVGDRLPSSTSEPQSISDAYVVAALFGDTPRAALSHLSGMRELVRLRGGISTFQPPAARMLQWCEYFACALHGLPPSILPVPPAPSSSSRSQATSSSSAEVVSSSADVASPDTPFPSAFLSALAAAHSRTLARLPARWLRCRRSDGRRMLALTRVVYALHLVSAAKSAPAWAGRLMVPGEGRDAVARVLGGAEHALLVELAGVDGGGNGGGGFGDEGGEEEEEEVDEEEEEEEEEEGWLRGILLHAAQTYLWTCLGDLPPGSPMNVVFLERLRRALDLEDEREAGEAVPARGRGGGADVGGCGGAGGGGVRAALARCGDDAEGGLVWALAVGWSSAFTIRTAVTARGNAGEEGLQADRVMAARGEAMLAWFEDRIVDALGALGEDGVRRAVCVVDVFPGTEGFRRGWQALLQQERFQWAARR